MRSRLLLILLFVALLTTGAGSAPEAVYSFSQAQNTERSPERWREWPVVPELSEHAVQILASAATNTSLNLRSISKIGDCQFTPATFLAGYVKGDYPLPEEYERTAHYSKESMVRDSITAANGLGVSSVLNPMFAAGAGYQECQRTETPLDCELRTRRPVVVLVALGTNWKPRQEITFEEHLRTVVETILASGALPILATKADNIEEDWKLNLANARVAADYDIPLVNVWRAVQPLPNNGLQAPNNVYLTADGWVEQNRAWLRMLDKVRVVLEP